MEAKQLIKEYRINKGKILNLSGNLENFESLKKRQINLNEDKFDKQITKIKSEKDNKLNRLEREIESKKKEIKSEQEKLIDSLENVDRIVNLLKLQETYKKEKKDLDINDKDITNKGEIKSLGYLINDDFLKIKVFLVENDEYRKKVNRFCLEVYGNSLFSKILGEKFGISNYGLQSSESGKYHHITQHLKDFKTKEEAKKYFIDKKDRILKGLIDFYKEIKEEYLKVISTYRLSEFNELYDIVKISEREAPLICNIIDYKLNIKLRLYNNFYYSNTDSWKKKAFKKEDIKENYDQFIRVNNELFKIWCAKNKLEITQTGNLAFGDWWTLDIEPTHYNKVGCNFSKKNFEREVKEAKKFFEKNKPKEAHLSIPKIEWFNEDLI